MPSFRLLILFTAIAVLFASTADAHRRHYRHHHDRFDVGDAIVGAAILGGIIAVANAGKKQREERRADPPAPPAPYPNDDYPRDGYPEDERGDVWERGSDWGYADPDYERRFPSERAAVDACAREAEALGGRYGADARLSRIYDVQRSDRDYRVTGNVEIDDARAGRREEAAFTCFADRDQVTGFRFETQTAGRY